MSKKIIAVLLSLLILFSFSACRKRIPDETAKPEMTAEK